MNEPQKPALVIKAVAPEAEDLRLINQQAKVELTAEDVYTFAVRLCDNEVDRDMERLPPEVPGASGGAVPRKERHLRPQLVRQRAGRPAVPDRGSG